MSGRAALKTRPQLSNGTAREDAEEAEAAREGSRRQPRAKRRRRDAQDDSAALIGVCKDADGDTEDAAKAWLGRYTEEQAPAIAELLTLIVQAAGCSLVVSGEDVEEGEIDSLVAGVRKDVCQNGYTDHFKGKAHRGFPPAYLALWSELVQKCADRGALYDQLLEPVCHLLTGLSSSDVRSLRYVGTLTAAHVATALVRIIASLAEEREIATRQHAVEAKRKGNKAAQERAAAFERTSQECHSHINELEAYVGSVFQGVLTNRFRDVDEEMREIVVDGLGNWTALYPPTYLTDTYLKYIAWALSDRAPGVRQAALEALLGVLEDPGNLEVAREVVSRFRQRLVEMPDDVHDSVAIKAVQLLTRLVKLEELPHSQVTNVFQLLLEDSATVREAAADLVKALIDDCGRQFIARNQAGQKGRRKSQDSAPEEEVQLAGVLYVMEQLDTGEGDGADEAALITASLAAKLVDVLFDRVPVLSNWRTLTEGLLGDAACEARGSTATTHLALLLRAAAAKGCGGDLGLAQSAAGRKGQKAKAAAAATKQQHELTMVMSRVLLQLLRKYQADSVKSAALVGTIAQLKLDIFSIKRDEKGLQQILKTVVSLLRKHASPATVRGCVQALAHCAEAPGGGPQEPGHSVFVELAADLADRLHVAVDHLLALSNNELRAEAAAGAEAGECEEVFDCRVALLRVREVMLASPVACENERLCGALALCTKAAVDGRPIPPRLVANTLRCQALVLLWRLQQALESDGSSSFGDEGQAPAEFVSNAAAILAAQQINASALAAAPVSDSESASTAAADQRETAAAAVELAAAAVFCLADIFEVFRPDVLADNEEVPSLTATRQQADLMWGAASTLLEVDLGDGPGGADNLRKLRAAMLGGLGRLVLREVQPFASAMPGRLLSCLASADDDVSQIAKEAHQSLKKSRQADMPKIYVDALRSLFERLGDDTSQLTELGRKIAGFNAGFVASGSETATKILELGIHVAFQGSVPDSLAFLKGLLPLASRVTARGAERLAGSLEAAAGPSAPDLSRAKWEGYVDLLAALRARRAKLGPQRSSLRQPGRGAGGGEAGRRISFQDDGGRQGRRQRRSEQPGIAEEAALDEPLGGDGVEESSDDEANAPEHPADEIEPSGQEEAEPSNAALSSPYGRLHSARAANSLSQDEGEAEDGITDTPMADVPNTAEDVPSGLFMASADVEFSQGQSMSGGAGLLDRAMQDDDDEEDMPRIRPRHA